MKIESIREVKANLNKIVGALPQEGSVVITKNGRPCAVLMPVTEDTDLEIVAISQNRLVLEHLRSGAAQVPRNKDGPRSTTCRGAPPGDTSRTVFVQAETVLVLRTGRTAPTWLPTRCTMPY